MGGRYAPYSLMLNVACLILFAQLTANWLGLNNYHVLRSISSIAAAEIIGVGTMGSVGAAAPTIFSQWVQTMYLHPQYSGKNTFFIIESRKTSCFNDKVFAILGLIV